MNEDKVKLIIETMERIKQKPGMYIGSDAQAIFHFINGLNYACRIFGIQKDEDVYKEIVIRKGWEYNAKAPIYQMIDRHMNYSDIIEEFLSIEIDSWKRTYNL